MAHKTVTIWTGDKIVHGKRVTPKFPYAMTGVPFQKSIGDIKILLQKFNCETIVDFEKTSRDGVRHTIGFEKDGLRYLIEFPITYVEHSTARTLNMDVSGRIVYNRVKALLVDAELNLLSFHEAMLPYLALPTPKGPMSVMEVIHDQIEGIKKGTAGLFLLPGGDR